MVLLGLGYVPKAAATYHLCFIHLCINQALTPEEPVTGATATRKVTGEIGLNMIHVDIDSDSACPAAFNATILYEDFATGLRGHLLAAWLATRLGRELKGNEHLWRFDVLDYPQCFRQAMEESTLSELIIVSAHGTIRPPSFPVAWLNEWVVYHVDNQANVIVSLDPPLRKGGLAPPFVDYCLNRLVQQLPCDVVLTYSEPAMLRKVLRRRASASHRNRHPI